MMEDALGNTTPCSPPAPLSDPRIDSIIHEVTEELRAAPEALGAILHGSHVRGTARQDSDVDFLCVMDSSWMDKEIRIVQGIEVEIQRMPYKGVFEDIAGRQPKPFTVASFADCRILFDQEGKIADLCQRAKETWKKGPSKPPSVEVLFGKSYLRHHLEEIDRLKGMTPQSRFPLEATISQTFLVAVRAFFRARGLWILKISDALAEIHGIDREFAALVQDYIDAPTLEGRIESLRKIVMHAISPLGELTIEYKTPRVTAENLPGAGSLLF
jgi:predicted nucleotidyltransferase